jgi:CheY-like chemotaxis protein
VTGGRPSIVVGLLLLASIGSASAQCAWVLWQERPALSRRFALSDTSSGVFQSHQICELVAEGNVDVVVMDYAAPGETGLWLLDRIQERPRPVPVIVVTGYSDLHAAELSRAPCARVLPTPTDPWQLCAEVQAVARAA